MRIFDIFSKRQRKLRGEMPDVYTYDDLPEPLRVQIVHIWQDTLGNAEQMHRDGPASAYKIIVETLCREYGVFHLPGTNHYSRRNFLQELATFF